MRRRVSQRADQTTVAQLRGEGPHGETGWCLIMLSAPELGRRIELPAGELTFGRASHCSVVLPLGGVSRVHCSLRRDARGTWLRDLGSTNGTQLNGSAVRPHDDVQLRGGDLIGIAGTVFKLFETDSLELDYHAQVFRTLAFDDLTRVHNRRKLQDACGDRALQHIALLLARQGRRENCTARFGGDEFAIVLAETPLAGALVFAERVRAAIEAEAICVGDASIELTISIGAAEWLRSMRRPEDLIAVADAALYRAKDAGRNRVASP